MVQTIETTAGNQNASSKRVKTCQTGHTNHDHHGLKTERDIIAFSHEYNTIDYDVMDVNIFLPLPM